jgi:hypothetical protein
MHPFAVRSLNKTALAFAERLHSSLGSVSPAQFDTQQALEKYDTGPSTKSEAPQPAEIREVGETGPTIDKIDVAEFESHATLKEWLKAKAPAFSSLR